MHGIRKIAKALNVLQGEVKKDIRVQHMSILIKLAFEYPEPVPYADLAKFCDTTRASISRNIKILGVWMLKDPKTKNWTNVGLGLVESRMNPYNTREYIVKLTDAGFEMMQRVNNACK